jgi:polyhydroxyalkanoate synthase
MVEGSELLDGGFLALAQSLPGSDPVSRGRKGMLIHRTMPRPEVATTPYEVVHRQNKLELKFYAPSGPVRRAPLVVVPSMINRAYILDLEPDRSLVASMAALGHPVYLVDWGVPGPEDAEIGTAEVVLDLLRRAVDRACRHARAPKAILLGYCMGGTLSVMFTALRGERIAALAALATPVRYREGGRFAAFCRSEVCVPEALVDEDGLVAAEVMEPAFKLLDPMGNWDKFLALEAASHNPAELKRALARERWLEENVPVPGKLAVEFIRYGYQEDRLLEGTWEVRGERVDVRRITCPVLVTPCSKDFIAPPPACVPLARAVGSADSVLEMQDTGHIGVVVGSFGPKRYFPLLDRWIRRVAPEEDR